MMRTALLPAGTDPFLNSYWLRNYRNVWADEVDELRILMCGQAGQDVLDYMGELVAKAPHATISYYPDRLAHGVALSRLVEQSREDSCLMLCEDDAFVRYAGMVDKRFRSIESGEADIIGGPRGCASGKLIRAAHKKFGPSEIMTGTGESGHSLWPCFLFIKRSDLLRTDGHFDARNWDSGETIKGLDYTADEPLSGDTFVSASYQLRDLGLRIRLEPQYRVEGWRTDDWKYAPWFHVGSLSSGYGSHILTERDEETYRFRVASARVDTTDWSKRCSFWQRVWAAWDGCLPELHMAYGEALDGLIGDLELSPYLISRWDADFTRLVTWEERPQ